MNKDKSKLNYYTYKLDMVILNVLAILLFIVVGGLVFFMEYKDNYVFYSDIVSLFIFMIIWLIIHEILHGIGFSIFKCVDKRSITFGMFLEKGIFYCMCKQNIPKKVILTSLFFPVTIIGVVTLIIGMIINSYILVFLSVLNIVSSIGDIVMIIYFIKVPSDIIYLDLDDPTSFTVVTHTDISNLHVIGIKLDSTGIYDSKKMVSHDRRRVVISKYSYVLIFIFFILILIKVIGGIL